VGLPIIEADALDSVTAGDEIEVDLSSGLVRTRSRVVQGEELPKFLQEILQDGGLVEYRKRHPRNASPRVSDP